MVRFTSGKPHLPPYSFQVAMNLCNESLVLFLTCNYFLLLWFWGSNPRCPSYTSDKQSTTEVYPQLLIFNWEAFILIKLLYVISLNIEML